MALFRRLFYRKPPDRLLEIAERVYVFDCCFSTETLGEGEYKDYMGGIIAQLQDYYADASLMVCNFRERDKRSQISDMLSPYDVMVMDYPLQSEGCPLLPLVMIHHFLKSSESWLSMEGLHNVLLMHCERGCWPVLAFMLASLLLYRKQYTGEQKTLEMAYKQAPKELLHLLSPLNPQASHLRYLQYISRRGIGSDWPPQDTPFTLESLMLWAIPRFDGESGCRPMVRIYRQDHLTPTSPKILFATPRAQKHIHHYSQAKAVTIKINARCHVQGDVVIECLHMDKDLEHEEMMFRVMFNTAFVQSKILALTRDEIDIVWSAKDQFPRDFKIEVVFSDSDAFKSETSTEPIAEEGDETEYAFTEAAEEFFEVEEVFSSADWHGTKRDPDTPATRDPERSPKGEAYSLTDKTRSGLEMSISEYDSKTMITQDFADVEKVGVNLETHKKVVAETLAGLDIVVPIEDKTIIESSTIPQGRNGNSNSIAEEKNASEISNFKLEKEVDKKVSVFMKSMAGMQKQELYNSTNNMGKMISRMRSTIIGDVPSSGTICHSRDTDRFIAEDKVQPQCEGSFGTSGITYPTMSRLPTSNAKDEKIDEMTVFLDYMGTCEEKNILEVSYGQHEVKDIVALDVEDKSTTKTYNIKHDADHLVTNKMITLPDIYCESEDPALTGKAESRLEQRECKLGPDIIVNRKKSTQTGKGHYPGTQDMQSAVKFKMEMRVRKDDIGKGVAQIKIDPKAVRQKALNDEQVQTTEETLYTISKKTPTCIRPPGNDVSKPKIEQQECVGDPKVSAKPKKVFRWISQKESSDTTSAISACYNIDNVAEDTVSSASVSGTSTSLQLPSQSSLLPLPPSIEELHHVVPLMALHCENLFFLPSQLQACLPPPSPPLPPPKSAKVAILASPSYTTTKMPTSPPLPTSHYPLGNASSTSPPPPPSRLSSVRASADGLSPPLSPRPAAIVPVMFVKGSPPQPMLSGESTKGPPSPDSHVSSEASVKNAAPPPPPPPLYPRSTMKGPLMAQSLSPSLIKNLSSIPPPPPLLPNQGGRTQGPPSPPPPLLSNQGGRTHCLPPPPPPQLPNQGGRILGPPPPPPPPLRPNINISVSHPQCSAISGKCSSVLPPVPPPVPPLKSSSNATELPGGSAPIPQCLPPPEHGGNQPSRPALVAHGGTPPPPPPPRARTPNRRGSPRVRRSPSPSLSARPASQVDDRGLSPRRRVTFPTASSSLAPRKPSLKPLHWVKVTRAVQGSLWAELQKSDDAPCASEFDVSELESLFSAMVPKKDGSSKTEGRCKSLGSKPDKVYLIDLRRANNTEIMLTKVKMPLSDMMSAALAMDDSLLDVDQVDNLIKFCPTKEEMELLKGYTGDKQKLGKCEQYFLELMKVPRVESKLRVFSFKIQFGSQVSYLRTSLNTINSICEQVRSSVKLKEIMKKILYLGNTLNQGTARGSAIGFRLDGLLKLTDTRAANNKMTLMHYLCKALAMKSPHLLDFHEEITSLEAASKIQLKYLAEEMQAIVKGLEKVELELQASEHDGPVSEVFRKTLKEFTAVAGAEVQSLSLFYTEVGRKADALGLYFGEDPAPCPFERVVSTLLNFVLMFRRAQQENCKQAELEKKKAEKKREMDKSKPSTYAAFLIICLSFVLCLVTSN